jgi:hypothetical protein
MVCLLVWDKNSYTGGFFLLFLCRCVLQSKLIHLYQTSSLFPSPLPIVASPSLKLCIHSYTVSTSTTFKFMVSVPFSLPPVCDFPLVSDLCPIILLHLFYVYNPHMRENMWLLAFWAWLTYSLKMIFSSSIHLLTHDKASFFFVAE